MPSEHLNPSTNGAGRPQGRNPLALASVKRRFTAMWEAVLQHFSDHMQEETSAKEPNDAG